MGICCWGCTFTCDWIIGSGNGSAVFGTCAVIGWAGVCWGNGIGWFVLTFLLSPALPWPILGLGIGCVGSPLSTWCTNNVGGKLCVGSDGNGLCFPSLTCGFRPLFAPCISGILMPLDFACDLVCTKYLSVLGWSILLINLIEMIVYLTSECKWYRNDFVRVTVIHLLSR